MIWEVEKDGSKSQLVGTAHFFPHSFRASLTRCLENARIAMFEGPLDSENMAKVVNSGLDPQSSYHLFDDLDRKIIDKITRELAPPMPRSRHLYGIEPAEIQGRKPVIRHDQGHEALAGLFYGLVQLSKAKRVEALG